MLKEDKALLLLGILRSHQSHGYELNALLESPLVPIRIGRANAYQLLNSFEEQGWVAASEERDGNRPPRRVFVLTPLGEDEFQRLLRARLASHMPADHANAVSLNFVSLLPQLEAVALLSQRLETIQRLLDDLKEQVIDGTGDHYGVDYLVKHAYFEKEWLEDLIDRLAAGVEPQRLDQDFPMQR